ncbi:recombinase family protein [Streptomyces sp. NPDC001315]|uniref:recombinase family protein n=1 Tax=Streptomyces sp. NPDC001315 TaxID=3364562 RepID=UPI0036C13D62
MANLVYKRVSSDQQSTARQNLVLDEAGIENPVVFEEDPGTSSRLHPLQRPKFGELLMYARPDDTVHISEMFRLVRGTQPSDHGRESAILIIRHVIGRDSYIGVIEANPASRVVNFKQPLAAARPEGHISPQRHLPVRYGLAAHGQRRRPRGSQPGSRCM